MDTYHKVLLKLYEVTEGKESKTIDFKDFLKKIGYLGSYLDIFDRMNQEGWLVETSKQDFVKITHWGVREAKKTASMPPEAMQNLVKETNRAKALANEILENTNNFAKESTKENLVKIEQSIGLMNEALANIKKNL
jgi:hypothetical protein